MQAIRPILAALIMALRLLASVSLLETGRGGEETLPLGFRWGFNAK